MNQATLTSGQIARMLDIPARTIRSYLTTGKIQAEQNPITGRWRIRRDALLDFMRKHGLDPAQLNRPLRVLVLDRDMGTGGLVRRALTDVGRIAVVEIEADCASALISLGHKPPDLLVLDDHTAGQRCRELIDAIRAHERTQAVRVLLLRPRNASQEAPAKTHAWIEKPLAAERLAASVQRLLARPA